MQDTWSNCKTTRGRIVVRVIASPRNIVYVFSPWTNHQIHYDMKGLGLTQTLWLNPGRRRNLHSPQNQPTLYLLKTQHSATSNGIVSQNLHIRAVLWLGRSRGSNASKMNAVSCMIPRSVGKTENLPSPIHCINQTVSCNYDFVDVCFLKLTLP